MSDFYQDNVNITKMVKNNHIILDAILLIKWKRTKPQPGRLIDALRFILNRSRSCMPMFMMGIQNGGSGEEIWPFRSYTFGRWISF